MHLSKQEPLFNTQPKRPMRRRESAALLNQFSRSNASSIPVAVFVLGPVGAGKTTFLNYTRRISSREFFDIRLDRAYPHWIQIDFRGFSPDDSAVDFIYNTLFKYIKDDPFFSDYNRAIRSAYSDDIASLKRGPLALLAKDETEFSKKVSEILTRDYENVRPYVDKLISYAAKVVPIFLVFDNVDQFEKEATQAAIFSDAMAMAVRLGSNIIISMRESTFVRHRNSAVFDAFDFDPLTIEHPKLEAVLARRLNIAKHLLKGRSGEFRASNGALVRVADLSIFMEMVQKSVLGTTVGRRIGVLADGDVRLALRMTRHFLERGYSDPGKAIEYYKNDNTYTLPPHEAFRAILIGNSVVYAEDHASVGNPFDARLAKTNDQMLRLFVLTALVRFSSESTFQYIAGTDIRDPIRQIGFPDDHIIMVLQNMCELRFVHTSSHGFASFQSNYYPSRLGGYIVKELIADFTFLENVMMDTFVDSDKVWQTLTNLSEEIRYERDTVKRITARIKRVEAFYNYAESLYIPLASEASRRGLSAEWCSNPLMEQRQQMISNCEGVLRSAENIYGKRSR